MDIILICCCSLFQFSLQFDWSHHHHQNHFYHHHCYYAIVNMCYTIICFYSSQWANGICASTSTLGFRKLSYKWSNCLTQDHTAAAKSLQSCPTLCDRIDGSPPALLSLGFSRQEHWSGLPFPSPMHESEKWKGSRSVVSDS